MAETLNVELRQSLGKRNTRRLRASGVTPAVLYGHGEETLSLSVPTDQLSSLVRQGSRAVVLSGAVESNALLRELQWNTWGTEVLHVDFTRIAVDERVSIEVAIVVRGEAPGIRAGGVVEQLLHRCELECPAIAIPDKLEVNVNSLQLEGSISLGDLECPEDVKFLSDLEAIVVQCVVPAELPDEDELAAQATEHEPEVIGRKEEEEGDS